MNIRFNLIHWLIFTFGHMDICLALKTVSSYRVMWHHLPPPAVALEDSQLHFTQYEVFVFKTLSKTLKYDPFIEVWKYINLEFVKN